MPGLTLNLATRLKALEVPDLFRPEGPLFHRWIPNGAEDAIRLSDNNEADQLSVWFERRAKKDSGGFLQWDRDGSEFDAETMHRQEKLDGGLLFGELTLAEVPEEALAAMKRYPAVVGQKFGHEPVPEDPDYIALAKRVVRYVQPRLSRFISQLRNQYGQYWLREIEPWDSRRHTIGSYCVSLGIKWWNEDLGSICRFIPTQLGETIMLQRLPGREYGEYLTQDDWRKLQNSRCRADASIEMQLLGTAIRLLDSSETRQPFVEVVTALEIAISNRLRNPVSTVQAAMQRFTEGPLRSQAAVVLHTLAYRQEEIEDVLRVLEVRNAIVHEGATVSNEDLESLRRVMQIVARLIGIGEVKIPALDSGNAMSPPGGRKRMEIVSSTSC